MQLLYVLARSPCEWRTTMHWSVVPIIFNTQHICYHAWKTVRNTLWGFVVLKFWREVTFSPQLENNDTLQCTSHSFPCMVTYNLCVENGQSYISMNSCLPIAGKLSKNGKNVIWPGPDSLLCLTKQNKTKKLFLVFYLCNFLKRNNLSQCRPTVSHQPKTAKTRGGGLKQGPDEHAGGKRPLLLAGHSLWLFYCGCSYMLFIKNWMFSILKRKKKLMMDPWNCHHRYCSKENKCKMNNTYKKTLCKHFFHNLLHNKCSFSIFLFFISTSSFVAGFPFVMYATLLQLIREGKLVHKLGLNTQTWG